MLRQLKNDLRRFMIGRYGNDALNNFIFGILLIIFIVQLFYGNLILQWIYAILVVIMLFRALSKRRAKRSNENRIFLKLTRPIRSKVKIIYLNLTDKGHRYYICPQCNAKVRIPSGHGKVAVTCPHCRHEFTKRS